MSAIEAACAFHGSESQAFMDGNQRTASVAARAFLDSDGVVIGTNTPMLCDVRIAIAAERRSQAGLAGIFRHLAQSH